MMGMMTTINFKIFFRNPLFRKNASYTVNRKTKSFLQAKIKEDTIL